MSMKFTPAASIFTSAWPGPGAGAGRSMSSYRSASGPPDACTRIAFIRVSTVFLPRLPCTHENLIHRTRQHGPADGAAPVAGGPHAHGLQSGARPRGPAQAVQQIGRASWRG